MSWNTGNCGRMQGKVFYPEGGQILEPITQSGCGISVLGNTHNSAAQRPEQCHLIGPDLSGRLDWITSRSPL